jgi:glycosyltransferase involved in cell wall biosynthesis
VRSVSSVSPERSARSDGNRLSVGLDATPLLGQPTGVGVFCAGALSGLASLAQLDVSGFAVSWRRRRGIEVLVPKGVSTRQRAMPARPLHSSWRRFSWPPVEWFIGRHDVVHGTNFVVPPTDRAARVMTVHDLTVLLYPELCDPPTLVYPELIRRAAGEGAWVHTPSQFVADQVIAEMGVDPERVRAIHHGVPALALGADQDGPRPFTLPDGCSRYVVAVGTIEPRKDYPLLVSAFGAVSGNHPDVALVIVGGEGWGADRYRAAVEASPARSKILRVGYLTGQKLAAALQNASLLAYPSLYEGFGFPPLQAMAAGVPVVATAAGAIPEVVGDAALLSESGDADRLAESICQVLDGGHDIEDMVQRGRNRSDQFTWTRCAEGLAQLYADASADVAESARNLPTAPGGSIDSRG